MKNFKVVILFYVIMLAFTFVVSAKVTKLESKEDYYKYQESVAINILS